MTVPTDTSPPVPGCLVTVKEPEHAGSLQGHYRVVQGEVAVNRDSDGSYYVNQASQHGSRQQGVPQLTRGVGSTTEREVAQATPRQTEQPAGLQSCKPGSC